MEQEKTGRMSAQVACWPESDTYFRAGVEAMMEQAPELVPGELSFVHLCGYTLKVFLNAYPALLQAKPERKVVIVATPRMMPMAKKLAAGDERVFAVFPSNLPVRRLLTALTHPVSHDRFRTARSAMSSRDIYILRHHLRTGPVGDLSEKYALSVKAVYWRKAALARMLGVRKLEHLLLVD